MTRIKRLSEDLVNKIAAGEVVERPASVVKELVENALDASARKLSVEIEAGGKRLVRVKDDGSGMSREDARLALERHATSKLGSLEDLEAIATNGFRGEALPSIASVSHLILRTRDTSGPAGTEVEVRHGRSVHVRDAGHPVGTTVEVQDLFGDVPARRKFLRADATEAGHIAEIVTQLALAHPQIGFRLASGRRLVIDAPPVDGLAGRLFQLFGGPFLEALQPVEGGEGWARVSGFVSRPDRRPGSRTMLRLFVNGRPVRDRGISKAVTQAFKAAALGDWRPQAIVFIEVPYHLVDVNVHPAKTEVRFADTRTVWGAVQGAVREALSSAARETPRADTSRVEEAVASYLSQPEPASRTPLLLDRVPLRRAPATTTDVFPGDADVQPETPAEDESAPAVIGQHRNTYILATDGADLVLVDQHTAHERVRFERLLERLAGRSAESQLLLAPLVVSLPPAQLAIVDAHADDLRDLGFDLEGFGGGALRLRAVPALLGSRDPGPALSELLRDFLERESADWIVTGARERLAATLACHSSVRAGQALSHESMAAILRDLAGTAHPTRCPHGRPTSVRIPREEVSRWFGRVGWRRE